MQVELKRIVTKSTGPRAVALDGGILGAHDKAITQGCFAVRFENGDTDIIREYKSQE